jgi:hypothetical protein
MGSFGKLRTGEAYPTKYFISFYRNRYNILYGHR